MEKSYEVKYHDLETTHWWFRARRDIIESMLSAFSKDARILEVGCSGGPLLAALQKKGFRHVCGVDISDQAIAQCRAKGLNNVYHGDASAMPWWKEHMFDVVVASDILEHMLDDLSALREWRRVLKPEGMLIVFVPAHRYLWSGHDETNHHIRRYQKEVLKKAVRESAFTIMRVGYWNFFLFPVVAAVRLAQYGMSFRVRAYSSHNLYRLPRAINMLLFLLLAAENRLLHFGIPLPIGVSLFCIARKPAA